MVESAASTDRGIFISYRRQDTASHVSQLYDRLGEYFGRTQLFMDIGSIESGADFGAAIEHALDSCDVLLVVIGRQWLTSSYKGRRRIDDPNDLVRLEVEGALLRDILMIPVLVDDAPMPRREELPRTLARLARRNAHRLSHDGYQNDMERLIQAIENAQGQEPDHARGVQTSTRPRSERKSGKAEEAAEAFRRAEGSMRDSEIADKRYCLELAAGSYKEAMRTDDPTWAPRAAVKLGSVQEVLGNQTDALAAYRYAMESHHSDWGPEGAFKLALLGSTTDIVGDAECLAAARFSINSEHTNWAPKAMTLLGRMLEKKGDFEGARVAYERALESRAEDTAATAAIYLGWLLEKESDLEGAAATYRRAIDFGAKEYSPAAAIYLGKLLEKQGDPEGARGVYQIAIDSGDRKFARTAQRSIRALSGKKRWWQT